MELKLVCPKCEKQEVHTIPESNPSNQLQCSNCGVNFTCKIVKIRAKNSRFTRNKAARYFSIRVKDLIERESQIEFENANSQDFELRSRDLAGFLYLNNNLRIVQNFTIHKYMTVSSPKCYLATFIYGENSSEVYALRAFRDKYLINRKFSACIVSIYYCISPILVNKIGNNPVFRLVIKVVISPILFLVRKSS